MTPSERRATVLSFKGLSLNLAYGLIGILYSVLVAQLRANAAEAGALSNVPAAAVEKAAFVKSIGWFPGYFLLTLIVLLVYAAWRLRKADQFRSTP